MFKRIKRILKSEGNSMLSKLEDPIKIMEQVISDSKDEIFKLYTSFEEIDRSIKKLSITKGNRDTEELVKNQKEKLENLKVDLQHRIETYKAKILEYQEKITYLREKTIYSILYLKFKII